MVTGGEEGEWSLVGRKGSGHWGRGKGGGHWGRRKGSGHNSLQSCVPLQVRLPDGKSLRYTLQSSTTLREVSKAVMADAPNLPAVLQFVQVTGYGCGMSGCGCGMSGCGCGMSRCEEWVGPHEVRSGWGHMR